MSATIRRPLRQLLGLCALSLAAGPLFAATCEVEVEANDAMQFNKQSIDVSKSCKEFKVKLKHVGKLPKSAMGHNWVLVKAADMQGVASDGLPAGLDKDYLKPGDARVIAHTKVLGPGESDTATIPVAKLSTTESYAFFCSFPGHSVVMKGTLKLVN
ncbi:azurin [Ramlibacter sp. H39-3-26]|uniref:azurin n=1 Tax=Curvibacter soli TaxID=3031331 RepID=UPI0023D98915|nr:azurin [Ramlibacter sp. H39-3-26]MDF1483894.1 azurin [Ramlibacter sp. H39-3-26]